MVRVPAFMVDASRKQGKLAAAKDPGNTVICLPPAAVNLTEINSGDLAGVQASPMAPMMADPDGGGRGKA
jgi:hypothetical protein